MDKPGIANKKEKTRNIDLYLDFLNRLINCVPKKNRIIVRITLINML